MDFCFLNDFGYATNIVGLGVDAHWEMILKGRELQLGMIERFAEYYQDAKVAPEEFADWVLQIQVLQMHEVSQELLNFLHALTELISVAKALGKPVHALAD